MVESTIALTNIYQKITKLKIENPFSNQLHIRIEYYNFMRFFPLFTSKR